MPAEPTAELADGDDALAVSSTLHTFADGGAGNEGSAGATRSQPVSLPR